MLLDFDKELLARSAPLSRSGSQHPSATDAGRSGPRWPARFGMLCCPSASCSTASSSGVPASRDSRSQLPSPVTTINSSSTPSPPRLTAADFGGKPPSPTAASSPTVFAAARPHTFETAPMPARPPAAVDSGGPGDTTARNWSRSTDRKQDGRQGDGHDRDHAGGRGAAAAFVRCRYCYGRHHVTNCPRLQGHAPSTHDVAAKLGRQLQVDPARLFFCIGCGQFGHQLPTCTLTTMLVQSPSHACPICKLDGAHNPEMCPLRRPLPPGFTDDGVDLRLQRAMQTMATTGRRTAP